MPRLASARLIERPAEAAVFRGSRRRSRIVTRYPRRARKIASSEPARPGADERDLGGVARGFHGLPHEGGTSASASTSTRYSSPTSGAATSVLAGWMCAEALAVRPRHGLPVVGGRATIDARADHVAQRRAERLQRALDLVDRRSASARRDPCRRSRDRRASPSCPRRACAGPWRTARAKPASLSHGGPAQAERACRRRAAPPAYGAGNDVEVMAQVAGRRQERRPAVLVAAIAGNRRRSVASAASISARSSPVRANENSAERCRRCARARRAGRR